MISSLTDMAKGLFEANNEPINTIDNVEYLRNPNEVPMDEIEAKVTEEFHISIEEEPLQEAKPPQKLKEFPLDIFPRSIGEYIEKTCEAVKSPQDFLGLSVLVAVSALIGNQAKIQVSAEWLEPCIVYAAFVGTPGVRKTPSLRKALFPIVEIQRELTRQYEQEKMNYEFGLKQIENEFAKWKSIPAKNRNIEDRPEEPVPPKHRQIKVNDITVETVMELMQENSLLMERDEFAGWITSMNQYKGGSGSERQTYLEYWNGNRTDVNRKGFKHLYVDHPFISIIGGIQPDRLSALLSDSVNDGFLERILFVYPDTFPEITLDDIQVDDSLKETYSEACKILYYDTKERGNEYEVIGLTPEAKALFKQYYDSLYEEMRRTDFNKQLEGAWTKLSSYFARFTLILHLFHWACHSDHAEDKHLVNEHIVYFAVKLIDYFKSHTERVYGFIHSDEVEKKCLEAVEWIQSKTKGVVRTRDVQQAKLCGVKNAKEAAGLFTLLCERGYGTTQKVKSANGRETIEFTLNG